MGCTFSSKWLYYDAYNENQIIRVNVVKKLKIEVHVSKGDHDSLNITKCKYIG